MTDRGKPDDAKGLCSDKGARPGLTVLVIDDQEMILDIFEVGLTGAGYAVLKAASGSAGMKLFKENRVDAILCDLGMPHMDGWAVAKAIRHFCEENGVRKPPLIFVTAWAHEIDGDERIGTLGIDAVLGKPITMDALIQTLKHQIDKRGHESDEVV
ncbi:MAG: response regulator [Desulfomonilaceae bacterium]|nr:response regulator [Desulfomonilaceae bacterium]